MRPLIVVLACFLFLSTSLFAQGEPGIYKSSLGIGGELSIPVGDLSNVAGVGYGGFARYQYGVDSRTALTITSGYTVWSEKELGANASVELKAFRFLIGGKFYVAESFFASVEAGTDAYSSTYTGSVVGVSGTEWRFMLPIGIGFQKNGFELGGKYYLMDFDAPSFSITLGYNWMLG